ISLPVGDGIPVPAGLCVIAGKLSAVGPHIEPNVVSLGELDDLVRKLTEPIEAVPSSNSGISRGITQKQRIVPILLRREVRVSQFCVSARRPRLTPLHLSPRGQGRTIVA